VVGDLDSHDTLCRRLALEAHCRVIAIDYRLAPEHRFPRPVEDCVTAVRWVLEHAEELGMDPARVAVAGDSAGGNLSAVVALHTRGDERHVALQVLIYPGTDATCSLPSHTAMASGYFLDRGSIDWYLDNYRDSSVDDRDPDLSPLWADSVAGVAPALIVTAGFDPLRDEGEAYAKKLEKEGVAVTYREHPSLIHGFALMTEAVPAARDATLQLARDIARLLSA
jgi:acetyl esterase